MDLEAGPPGLLACSRDESAAVPAGRADAGRHPRPEPPVHHHAQHRRGPPAGVASALGVETGTLVHIAAAAAGLSALVAASATAFGFLRYAGAAYLVYLAYRTLRSRHRLGEMDLRPQPIHRVYLDGALVNVLNPKVVLFFLAFLPQFVDQDAGAVPLQIAAMGLATALIGLVSDMGYAWPAAQ